MEQVRVTLATTNAALLTSTDATKTNTASIDAKTPPLGPALKAASAPVTMATDQPAIPVDAGQVAAQWAHISTNATTTCKTGAGVLHSVAVNGAGAGFTATLKDGAAVIGVVTVMKDQWPAVLRYDLRFATSLVIVTTGMVPGPADLTVTFD